MTNEVNPVELVTINQNLKIQKNGEAATNIEVVRFTFDRTGETCGFNLIAQIGLYEIGDKAIFIQPDYCVPNTELFSEFIAPGGEPKRTRLGTNNRIKSSKFTFSFEDDIQPIWSFGILLSFQLVESYLINKGINIGDCNLTEALEIVKYEEPEPSTQSNGLIQGDFPYWMYKTDEIMYQNIVNHIKMVIERGEPLGLSLKVDGSSLTVAFKKINGELKPFVCSRMFLKKLNPTVVSHYVDNEFKPYRKHFADNTRGWLCEETGDFRTNDNVSDLTPIEIAYKDSWVDISKSSGLLDKGYQYCLDNDLELAFRAEIYGKGLKGSGNKHNPHSKKEQGLILFGLDDVSGPNAIRLNGYDLWNVAKDLNLPVVPTTVITPHSYEDLCNTVQLMFDEHKKNGEIIEGIVVRTMETNNLSCKFINPEYDAKR